jgi:hypothetical protein
MKLNAGYRFDFDEIDIAWPQGGFNPRSLPGLAAHYDAMDFSSLVIDASNRVQLIGDKSAYSVDNCLVLPAVSGNYASTPDAAALHVTGDIGIMVHGSMVNYNTGTYQTLVSRLDGSINRSYWLDINNGGALSLNTTSDGTTGTLATGNSTVVTSIPNLSEKWIFATLDVDNGAAGHDYKFYLSDDGVTWTQLGTTVTTAGVISIFAGTSPLEIGSVLLGTAQLTAGNFKRVKIYNGYDFAGSVVFDEDFSLEAKLATSVTATTGQTVTINATAIALPARIHGARDLYMGTQASQPIYLGWSGTNYGYLNGVTGNGFSTPDSAALGITGDIDLRVKVAMDDWTPASNSMLISKRTSDDEWTFYLQTDGKLNINWWNSVAANSEVISTAATGFTDRTTHWVRVTLDVDNGAGGYTVNFYGSDDGITWTAVGDPIVTGAGTTDVKNSTSDIIVGAQTTFATVAAGAFYQAQIYDGIDGTLVADFNASDYPSSGGSTFFDGASTPALVLDGTSGTYASTPDSAAVSITGDIDVRAELALADWTPTGGCSFVSKGSGPGLRGWYLNLTAGGLLNWEWSADGTTTISKNSTATTGVTDLSGKWVRVTHDVDNGAAGNDVKFYLSDDGVSWTQLGTTVTTAATTSHFDSAQPVQIGTYASGTSLIGNVYRAQIYNGIAGTLAFDADFTAQGSNTTSFTESSANAATVTLNGNAHIGPRWTINGGATIVSRTGLYFDGTDDYFGYSPYYTGVPITVYIVLERVSNTAVYQTLFTQSGQFGIYARRNSDTNWIVYDGTNRDSAETLPLLETSIIAVSRATGETNLQTKRITNTTIAAADTTATYTSRIGWDGSSSQFFGGTIKGILVFSGTHDRTTRDRVMLYLGRKERIAV